MSLPKSITLVEVSPRDGLQNESVALTVNQRVELINRLASANVPAIEFGSFVSPKAVPRMAGADEVFSRIDKSHNVVYHALVPNQRGYENSKSAGVKHVRLVAAAAEPLHQANFRRPIDESLADHVNIVSQARQDGIEIEAVVAGALGDPFIGLVSVEDVMRLVNRYYESGVRTISVADTVGMGTPKQVFDVIEAMRTKYDDITIGVHFHDTRGTGLANALTALELGVTQFDASVGGTGGCPFAPKATGNISSEDLVHMLAGMGIETGVDLDKLIETGLWLQGLLGKTLPGKLLKAKPVYPVFHRSDAAVS